MEASDEVVSSTNELLDILIVHDVKSRSRADALGAASERGEDRFCGPEHVGRGALGVAIKQIVGLLHTKQTADALHPECAVRRARRRIAASRARSRKVG